MRRVTVAVPIALVFLTVFLPLTPTHATVHGKNGRIVFRRYLNEAQTRGAIFTINADGTHERRVTNPPRGVLTTEPDWSPNGKWIAFHVEKNGHTRVIKIRRDGSDRTFLSSSCTGVCLGDSFPAWSPNGRQLAIQRELCSAGSNNLLAIYVISANGPGARRVTQRDRTCANSHRFEDLAPQWAPDGSRIAFERVDNNRGKHAVFTVRLNGSGLRRVTPWYLDASQPDWSPDGRWIGFRTQEQSDDEGAIAVIHPAAVDCGYSRQESGNGSRSRSRQAARRSRRATSRVLAQRATRTST